MKRKLLSLSVLLCIAGSWSLSAQYAHETSVKFEKNNVTAVESDYNRSESVIEEALKSQLEKEGLGKPGKSKGYMTYKGVSWAKTGREKVDVYFKVDGNKSKTTITVLVSKGYGNFISSGTDPAIVNSIKEFLNSLESRAGDVQFGLDLTAQQSVITKAEKDYTKSVNDSTDLAMSKQKLEAKILEQQVVLQSKQKALEAERIKLSAMKNEEE